MMNGDINVQGISCDDSWPFIHLLRMVKCWEAIQPPLPLLVRGKITKLNLTFWYKNLILKLLAEPQDINIK